MLLQPQMVSLMPTEVLESNFFRTDRRSMTTAFSVHWAGCAPVHHVIHQEISHCTSDPSCKGLFRNLDQPQSGSLSASVTERSGWVIHLKAFTAGMFSFGPGSAEWVRSFHLFIFIAASITIKVIERNFLQLPWKVFDQERPCTKFHRIPSDLPCLNGMKKNARKSQRRRFMSSFSSVKFAQKHFHQNLM